jgi:plasmid stabilization system protein ParE
MTPLIIRPLAEADISSSGPIELQPTSFHAVEGNVRRAHLRRFPYHLFFAVETERLQLLAVLHAARHPRTWRERLP